VAFVGASVVGAFEVTFGSSVVGAPVDASSVVLSVALVAFSAPTIHIDTDAKVSKKENRTAKSDITGIDVR